MKFFQKRYWISNVIIEQFVNLLYGVFQLCGGEFLHYEIYPNTSLNMRYNRFENIETLILIDLYVYRYYWILICGVKLCYNLYDTCNKKVVSFEIVCGCETKYSIIFVYISIIQILHEDFKWNATYRHYRSILAKAKNMFFNIKKK